MADACSSSAMPSTPSTVSEANFLECFYQTFFHPVATFHAVAEASPPSSRVLFNACLAVLLISASAPMIYMANRGGNPVELVATVPLSGLLGLLLWLGMALIMALTAYAFTGKTAFRTFLTLSGFAPFPWLLFAPISLLKVGLGSVGIFLCGALGLSVWLWSVVLFALALMATYKMTVERVLIVLALPLVMSMVLFAWLIGFINNVTQLAPKLSF